MPDDTRENPNPPASAPTEPKGALVDEAEPAKAPIRGYAPPIIETAAPEPSSPAPQLPRLWLSFHSDGTALRCQGALQRAHMEHVQFDPNDPVVAQAYAFFVQQMVLKLDGPPQPAPPSEKDKPK